MRVSSLFVVIGLLAAGRLFASESACGPAGCDCTETNGSPACCGYCGRNCDCCKCCQVVPYVKEVKKYVWQIKCEDYCPSLPGCPLGGCDCDNDGRQVGNCKCNVCAAELAKKQVPPKCGCVHTKKILEKKDIVCKVPSYKCIVVYVCPSCLNAAASSPGNVQPKQAPSAVPALPTPPQQLPPPPKLTGAVPGGLPRHARLLIE